MKEKGCWTVQGNRERERESHCTQEVNIYTTHKEIERIGEEIQEREPGLLLKNCFLFFLFFFFSLQLLVLTKENAKGAGCIKTKQKVI